MRTAPSAFASGVQEYFEGLQERLCAKLEQTDGKGKFSFDRWNHADGGGGLTRVMERGGVFEKAGVNSSAVSGVLPQMMARKRAAVPYFATGISLVLHPQSPMVPTVHANLRFFEESGGDAWFGGGADLTPSYLFEEDAVHFHRTIKNACDLHGSGRYPKYKTWCDEYFYLKHRGETRGVGGIFFDDLKGDRENTFGFVRSVGEALTDAYLPIVAKRRDEPWGEKEREWQLLRRGRYVEFNLVYDRGTLFGLQSEGRIESILMSLPPAARWGYDVQPEPGSREAKLQEVLAHPREWV